MTGVLTAPPTAAVRPLPWRQLGWVVWRRYRTTLAALLGVLALLAVYLLVTGHRTRVAWHAYQACTPVHSQSCAFLFMNFQDAHSTPGLVSALFLFLPWLVGALVGAPVLGRELETGTLRYAWTQGVGRTRWMVAIVTAGALIVAALCGAAGLLITWYERPLWQADVVQRLDSATFPSTGIAVVAWGLIGYAVGVLAGYLWRRTLPALASAAVLLFGLAYVTFKARLHYRAPMQTSSLVHRTGQMTVSQWWEKDGKRVSVDDLNAALRSAGLDQIQTGGGKTAVRASSQAGQDPIQYLLHHGFTQWTSYQPSGRYWPFQWIEFGWLTAVALALLVATLLVLRRRDA